MSHKTLLVMMLLVFGCEYAIAQSSLTMQNFTGEWREEKSKIKLTISIKDDQFMLSLFDSTQGKEMEVVEVKPYTNGKRGPELWVFWKSPDVEGQISGAFRLRDENTIRAQVIFPGDKEYTNSMTGHTDIGHYVYYYRIR